MINKLNTREFYNTLYEKMFQAKLFRNFIDRFDFVFNFINKNDKIADLGCGCGELIRYLLEKDGSLSIVGYDLSDVAVRKCAELEPRAKYYQIDLNKDKLPVDEFTVIICNSFLEHIANIEFVLENIYASLKNNGKLIILVPYLNRIASEQHIRLFDENILINFLYNYKDVQMKMINSSVLGAVGRKEIQ
jgi:2-polyprenyl-3-methyl-5-hydroxy-6-metoxy-1,4-benzoquinol methylase